MKSWLLALGIAWVLLWGMGGGALSQTPTPTPPGEVKKAQVQGRITALDGTARTVTIVLELEIPIFDRWDGPAGTVTPAPPQPPAPPEGKPLVLTVTDNTSWEVWGKDPAGFLDLAVGDWAKIEYNAATGEVLGVEVKGKGEPSLAARQGFFGTVKAKTETSLTLNTRQGEVTLALNSSTRFWAPPRKDATLADVPVGGRVVVLAQRQDSSLGARRVLLLPLKPVRLQVSGTVSQVEGSTLTLTDQEGNPFTVELPRGLAAQVEVGDVLTLTLLQTPGVEKSIAGGMMRGEEMRQRLQGLADKVKARKAETEEERGKRAQDLEKLEALLQRNQERHQAMMEKALEKASPQAKAAIERAIERSRRGWEEARKGVEKAGEEGKGKPTPTPKGKGKGK